MYIRRESTREERAQIFSRQKTQGTKRCGEGREMSLLCDPGSELRLGGSKKKKGDQNKWDGEKKQEKTRKKKTEAICLTRRKSRFHSILGSKPSCEPSGGSLAHKKKQRVRYG